MKVFNAFIAAKNIRDSLQIWGVNTKMGITIGDCYCGLLGNNYRKEYVVMGGNVNLSARLMGKANLGEILCHTDCLEAFPATAKESPSNKLLGHQPIGAMVQGGVMPPVIDYETANSQLEDSMRFASAAPIAVNNVYFTDYRGYYDIKGYEKTEVCVAAVQFHHRG